MGGLRPALLVACLLAAGELASAECPSGGFAYAPAYVGSFGSYGFATDFVDPVEHVRAAKGKTGRVCKECQGKRRGIQLVSKREYGGGFLQYPVPVGDSFCVSARLDVSRMKKPGAFAGLEFDSPAVPLEVLPESYVFVGVQEEDGTQTLWVEESGDEVGSLVLPAGTRTVQVEIEYGGGSLSVRARAEQEESFADVIVGHAFPWAGSGSLGAAAFDLAAREKVGIALEAHGDVHGPALQEILAEIGSLLALEEAALADLDAAAAGDALAKIEEALARSDPALIAAVGALPASKAMKKAGKELTKAVAKLGRARDGLGAETPKPAAKIAALVDKARLAQLRARRVLETGSPAEAKRVRLPTS